MKDRAKTFMFVSIGILALTLAYLAGYQMASADVDFSDIQGGVVAVENNGYSAQLSVLTLEGEFWALDENGWSLEVTSGQFPVEMNDMLKFWSARAIFHSGEGWIQGSDNVWVNHGPVPGQPVPGRGKSMSDIKSKW